MGQMGHDLVFIHLTMTKEEKCKRLMHRHDGNEQIVEVMEKFEKILEINDRKDGPEPGAITLEVTGDWSREFVVEEVLKRVSQINN